MGKLADALKQKYKTPRAAIEALGLDASLLREDRLASDAALSSELIVDPYAYGYGLQLAMDAGEWQVNMVVPSGDWKGARRGVRVEAASEQEAIRIAEKDNPGVKSESVERKGAI